MQNYRFCFVGFFLLFASFFLNHASAVKFVSVGGSGDGNSAGSPLGSIQAAIDIAAPGETIQVSVGTYTESLAITSAVVIEGDWQVGFAARNTPIDATRTVIHAATDRRVVTFNPGNLADTLTLDGVRITGGDSDAEAILGGRGGGVMATVGGLVIQNCQVDANIARDDVDTPNNDASGYGGGIYADGDLTITDSLITQNTGTTADTSFSVTNRGGYGGGVFVGLNINRSSTITVTIERTTISDNVAQASDSAGNGSATGLAFGGGIGLQPIDVALTRSVDRGPTLVPTAVTLRDSILMANDGRRQPLDDGESLGGGIAFDNNGNLIITANIDTVEVMNNNASGSTSGFSNFNVDCRGGGIYFNGSGLTDQVTITNSTINGNIADAQGGNELGYGGGIHVENSTITVTNSTISNNVASEEDARGLGGGISIINSKAEVDSSDFFSNLAAKDINLYFPDVRAGGGGGIFNQSGDNGSLRVTNSVFINNETANSDDASILQDGGGIFNESSNNNDTIIINNSMVNTTKPNADSIIYFIETDMSVMSNINVQANIIQGGNEAISAEDGVTGVQDFNLFFDNTSNVVDPGTGLTGGTNNLIGDPLFLDPINGDLSLQTGSAAIDNGPVIPIIELDKNGNPRTEGDASDIGAFEFFIPVMLDFGDGNDTIYQTKADNLGPRHQITVTSPRLGSLVDAEDDSRDQADSFAIGDDQDGIDDEDGVRIDETRNCHIITDIGNDGNRSLYFDQGAGLVELKIGVSNSSGFLSAWVDFNGDGDFVDEDEVLLNNVNVDIGEIAPTDLFVPSGVSTNPVLGRFRISSTPGLQPIDANANDNGFMPVDGEVEDYSFISLRQVDIAVAAGTDQLGLINGDTTRTIEFTVSNNLSFSEEVGVRFFFTEITGEQNDPQSIFSPFVNVGEITAMPSTGVGVEINQATNTARILDLNTDDTVVFSVPVSFASVDKGGRTDFVAEVCTPHLDQNIANDKADVRLAVQNPEIDIPVDPADVANFLTSDPQMDPIPARGMLANFDINGDGVLDVTDVVLATIIKEFRAP
jgi:hypothetical protein